MRCGNPPTKWKNKHTKQTPKIYDAAHNVFIFEKKKKKINKEEQKRWDNDIIQVAGMMWNRVAQESHDWQTDLQK